MGLKRKSSVKPILIKGMTASGALRTLSETRDPEQICAIADRDTRIFHVGQALDGLILHLLKLEQ